jgi:hypothetical protein
MAVGTQPGEARYWQNAFWLSIFTIGYNLLEGLVSIYLGLQDEALTLLGFGVDSFIEVMSGIGILAMVLRIRRYPDTPRSRFEQSALRVTGTAFYLLAAGLAASAAYNLFTGTSPRPRSRIVIADLDRRHVVAGPGQTKDRPRLELFPDPCRRQLHHGVHLHVRGASGVQSDLRAHGVRFR